MRSQVAITRTQAQEHDADLLAAIGGVQDRGRWTARRDSRRQARRTAERYAWLRRVTQA